MVHKDHWRDGRRLVSVTELMSIINKPFLEKWKQSLCSFQTGQCGFVKAKQIAEEASGLGNNVHEVVAKWIANPEIEWVKQEEGKGLEWANQIVNKLKETGIKKYLIEPESTLLDEYSGLAGSPDFIGQQVFKDEEGHNIEDHHEFIGDLKIKNQLDPLTALQGCGYRYLVRRKYKQDLSQMVVVWAKKKTKSLIVELVWIDLNPWMDDWYALVKLWNRLNPARKVNILA